VEVTPVLDDLPGKFLEASLNLGEVRGGKAPELGGFEVNLGLNRFQLTAYGSRLAAPYSFASIFFTLSYLQSSVCCSPSVR